MSNPTIWQMCQCFITPGIRTDMVHVSRHSNSKVYKKPITSVPCNSQRSATSIQLRKAAETDSDSETFCTAEQQDHHNNPHLEYGDREKLRCQQMSPASTKRPHKIMLRRTCLTCTVKISHNEKLEALFNFT